MSAYPFSFSCKPPPAQNGDEPIDVTIEVQSNELVSLDPSLRHTQAVVLEKKDRSGGVDRANVFLSPTR